MYNSIDKEAFIRDYSGSEKTRILVRYIFTSFEQCEESYHLDLSLMSAEQLQPVVNKLTGLRKKSSELIIIILKEYVKWMARSGRETSRGIFTVHIDSYDKVRDQMVSSPLHLKSKLDDVFDPPELNTIDCIYRVFLWMAFSGLTDEEASTVTSQEVNFQLLYIEHGGHKYEIYKESIQEFFNACNSTELLFEHANYQSVRSRSDGDKIMRGFRSSDVKIKTIRPMIVRKFNQYSHDEEGNKIKDGYKLSYQRLYLSGVFYRAYVRERAGIPVNFSGLIALEMDKSEKEHGYTLNKNRTLPKIANTIAKGYIEDYERWKNAFDV